MNTCDGQIHIGVDVSKEKLDVYNPIDGSVVEIENSIHGFRKIRDLARKSKAVVCCEPTGGYELDLVMFLQRFQIQVAYCDGYKVRHYAKACGMESKNDRIDAKMISLFADKTSVRIIDEKDKIQLRLRQRYNLYKTFIDMHIVLAQKASSETDPSMRKMLIQESNRMKKKAQDTLIACVKIAGDDVRLSHLFNRFMEIDGVGNVTALAILAWLPEIGTMNDKSIVNLVGLAPRETQSGNASHTKHCAGGRKNVRCALYLASLSAVQHNVILSDYYHEAKKRMPGPKASKWAMVPVMRKLLVLMNKLASKPEFQLQKKPTIKNR